MQLVQVNKEEPGLSFPLPSSLGELTSCSWLHETGSPGGGNAPHPGFARQLLTQPEFRAINQSRSRLQFSTQTG